VESKQVKRKRKISELAMRELWYKQSSHVESMQGAKWGELPFGPVEGSNFALRLERFLATIATALRFIAVIGTSIAFLR